nr:hypothetical protein [Escherichia coli]
MAAEYLEKAGRKLGAERSPHNFPKA